MEPEEKKFSWKRLLITTGVVLVTSAVIGGSIWYVMDQQAREDKEDHDKQIQELQNQIDELKNTEENSTTEETEKTVDETENWKIYNNSVYGYSIKYPSTGYAVSEGGGDNSGNMYIYDPKLNDYEGRGLLQVYAFTKPEVTFVDFIQNEFFNTTNMKSAKVAGLDGYVFEFSGMSSYHGYAVQDSAGNCIVVSTEVFNDNSLFQQMLSTLTVK